MQAHRIVVELIMHYIFLTMPENQFLANAVMNVNNFFISYSRCKVLVM